MGSSLLALALVTGLSVPAGAVFDPVRDEDEYVAVHVGKLIVGNGEEQDGVTILLLDGKVEAIGKNVELPFPCEEIDARDMVAMPGLIHASTRRGLMNMQRRGVNAHRKITEEFLPADGAYDGAAEAGYTTLVLAPPGTSGFPGRGMVIRTADVGDGLILDDESYIGMGLTQTREKGALRKAFSDAQKEIDKLEAAREKWDAEQKKKAEEAAKKKAEAEKNKQPPKEGEKPKPPAAAQEGDAKTEAKKEEKPAEFKPPAMNPALVPLVHMIEKKDGAYAVAAIGGASTYLHFRDALRGFDLSYVLLHRSSGGGGRFGALEDLFFVADKMAENEESLFITPVVTTYPYSSDRVNMPQKFMEAGCKVAFLPAGDSDAQLGAVRFQVAEMIKNGMSRENAVKALTGNVAEALGLGDRLGTVEKGKDGNLILLSADPFDVQADVQKVLIEGNVVYDRDEEDDR